MKKPTKAMQTASEAMTKVNVVTEAVEMMEEGEVSTVFAAMALAKDEFANGMELSPQVLLTLVAKEYIKSKSWLVEPPNTIDSLVADYVNQHKN